MAVGARQISFTNKDYLPEKVSTLLQLGQHAAQSLRPSLPDARFEPHLEDADVFCCSHFAQNLNKGTHI